MYITFESLAFCYRGRHDGKFRHFSKLFAVEEQILLFDIMADH